MKGQKAFKKIDTKIYVVFIAVIAIAFFNAIFSSYTILKSQDTTQDIVNNSDPSLEALSQLNLLVTKSRMLITNWVYLPSNTSDKENLKKLNRYDYPVVKARLQTLMQKWSDRKMVEGITNVLIDYEKLTAHQAKIMSQLASFDDYQDPMKKFAAEDILERSIIPPSDAIEQSLTNIIQQQTKESKEKQGQMLSQLNMLMGVVFGIAILIVGSLFFAAIVISRSIIVPVMRVREIILEMSFGRLPEYRMHVPRNAVGEMLLALKSLIESVRRTSSFAEEIGKGNLNVPFVPLNKDDVHGHALLTMRNSLKAANDADARRTWLNEGLARLNNIMRTTSNDFSELLDNIVLMLVEYIHVQQAAIFLLHNDNMEEMHIQLGAYYALNKKILGSKRYELREGLVGQAIASNRIIDIENINDPYFTIDLGLAQASSCNLMIIPLSTSGQVVGALVVASLEPFTELKKEMMQKIAEPVAASIFSVRANLITTQLLEESRKQAEELANQEKELQQVNSELKEKARLLEEKNIAIEDAHLSLALKADQLEQSSKYKSAFLANMSHEFRTPLNSILILARILADNKNGSLTEKQVEHAKVIHKSGSDLLTLINDILDLSKVEAGKVELQPELFTALSLADDMRMLFGELANEKQINFIVETTAAKNTNLFTDKSRVAQIIKNLLSNAFKFTEAGGKVELTLAPAPAGTAFTNVALLTENNILSVSVGDSGIGIPKDKQALVFEAFKQADGSTSRKYGGTGLGLSICRDLAQLIGGEIQLYSEEGKGSTFTLYLPAHSSTNENEPFTGDITNNLESTSILVRDDRNELTNDDKRVLIIEDDQVFAQMLVTHCHQNGMKAIVAMKGDEGLEYAKHYIPDAIILDIRLPVMDGWTVLQKIKSDDALKQIPVHVVTSMDQNNMSMKMGADSYFRKPADNNEISEIVHQICDSVSKQQEKILALGNNSTAMEQVMAQLKEKDPALICRLANENEFTTILQTANEYRCILIEDRKTFGETIHQQIKTASENFNIPLIYLDGKPDECLVELNKIFNIPDTSKTEENSTMTFLENIKLTNSHNADSTSLHPILQGKCVLLVDDDMRNIYSMTSTLENEGMNVICAVNGADALEKLKENPGMDIILMDIMMPVMNGYEAIAEIRKNPDYTSLPIIAVTAKAMAGIREECIKAGASDYITKPVDTFLLLARIQEWLFK